MPEYVEPPTNELAEPDVDESLLDEPWVRDELAWLDGGWDRADDWIAEHGLAAAWERVIAYWEATA